MSWIRAELVALRKDFFVGIITIVFFVLLFLVGDTVMRFLVLIVSPISENHYIQMVLGFIVVVLLGIGSRKLQKSKRFSPFRKYIPSEVLKKPEVMYEMAPGIYQLGILFTTHEMDIHGVMQQMAEVVFAHASPTSAGSFSGRLVPYEKITFTGRTMGQVLAECISLGTKIKKIHPSPTP